MSLSLCFMVCQLWAENKKYNDAVIIGIYQGNPAIVISTLIGADDTNEYISLFNEDGSILSYMGHKVVNPIRDEKGNLISFNLEGNSGEYRITRSTLGIFIEERSEYTKQFSKDFVTNHIKTEHKDAYIYRSSEKVSASVEDDNKQKHKVTLFLLHYNNVVLDEYGNMKYATIKYSDIGLGGNDGTFLQQIEYWSDKTAIMNNQKAELKSLFHNWIFKPMGFEYKYQNKDNFYRQFYDYVESAGLIRESQYYIKQSLLPLLEMTCENKIVYYAASDSFYFCMEISATPHELIELRNTFMEYCESLGCNFTEKGDDGQVTSNSNILISEYKKKKITLSTISIQYTSLYKKGLRLSFTYDVKGF